MRAILKVRSHAGSELSIHLTFKIIRNMPPNFNAIDFDGLLRQVSLLPVRLMFSLCQMLSADLLEQIILRPIRQVQKGDNFARP